MTEDQVNGHHYEDVILRINIRASAIQRLGMAADETDRVGALRVIEEIQVLVADIADEVECLRSILGQRNQPANAVAVTESSAKLAAAGGVQ